MKRIALALAIAGVVAVLPAGAGASTGSFRGVVVAKERSTLLVAAPSGLVRAFSGRAAVGSRVVFSGGHLLITGRAHVARVRGIVIRRIGSTVFLSSNRHLLAVHQARGLAAAGATTTEPGDDVSEDVTIGAGGQLDEQDAEDLGHESSATVQAVVTAVGPGTLTLTVNGQSVTVQLPAGLTLPASIVGQTVTVDLSFSGQDDEQGDDAESSTTTGVVVSGGHEGGDSGGGDH
jgi:hypothetical protein